MKIFRWFISIGLFILIFVASGEMWHTDAYSGCGGVNPAATNASYEQQVLDLVNTERANASLPPLKRNPALDNAARYHAVDMAQDDYFDHASFDLVGGTLTQVCATGTRLGTYYASANAWGENIAAGYATPSEVMTGWLNSSGHRANILNAGFREIGIGYFAGGAWGHYWVQDFGKRNNVYPLLINRDAANTNSPQVSIYIYGSWQQMRLQNDNGSWGAWQPFQNNSNWTLNALNGTRTVNAELNTGTTTIATSDTIYLTYTPTLPGRFMLPLIAK